MAQGCLKYCDDVNDKTDNTTDLLYGFYASCDFVAGGNVLAIVEGMVL